jgi:hypothetical protein
MYVRTFWQPQLQDRGKWSEDAGERVESAEAVESAERASASLRRGLTGLRMMRSATVLHPPRLLLSTDADVSWFASTSSTAGSST